MVVLFFGFSGASTLLATVVVLRFPPTVQEGSLSPHPLEHLLVLHFLGLAILIDVRWCFPVGLICRPLIISDVEHFFLCLWP